MGAMISILIKNVNIELIISINFYQKSKDLQKEKAFKAYKVMFYSKQEVIRWS